MLLQKEKSKRASHPNHVEFVSPLSMSECISRIERVFKPQGCLWMSYVRLKLVPVDAETCEFRISKQETVTIKGKLIYQSDVSTLVACDAHLSLNTKGTLAFLAFFAFATLLLTGVSRDLQGLFYVVFAAFLFLFTLYEANKMRNSLLRDIKLILLTTKAKRS